MSDCILCGLDSSNNTFVNAYDYWTVLLNFKQPTLGSSLLVLNRHCDSLSSVQGTEWDEYPSVVRDLERSLELAFGPQRINHLMLANTVPHVHYHVVPRYVDLIDFAGMDWVDANYGSMPFMKLPEKSQEVIEGVRKTLQSNWSRSQF